ncbi:MAG: adenosine kinase [SAR324 cluster bacterium]|uniref:Adenosine kinase n=1 Tax=SAR324 cluster bacterium TaxID=2024889 RepID=A0A7X9FTU7_9DELT|nr:adenosine kinase [SAR324 cluster bacterium]
MKKKITLCAIGDAIVDCVATVSNEQLKSLGLKNGSMQRVDTAFQQRIFDALDTDTLLMSSGGAAANTLVTFSRLGGVAALFCSIAKDSYGDLFVQDLEKAQIQCLSHTCESGATGTSVILVTPDAERAMCTDLGVAGLLPPSSINEQIVKDSEWLFLEGYAFCDPPAMQQSMEKSLDIAKRYGNSVAFAFGDVWIVRDFRSQFDKMIPQVDLIFANEAEACEYTGFKDPIDAAAALLEKVSYVAVTAGSKGAFVGSHQTLLHIPSFPCTPVDLTSAGDTFAAAFLFGLIHGESLEHAGLAACYFAMKAITQMGARLNGDPKQYWEEARTIPNRTIRIR